MPLPQSAYIWQRQWTPALIRAMHDSSPLVDGWRVLGAELSARGDWTLVTPHWPSLQTSSHPVTLVVRLSGQLDHFQDNETIARIATLSAQWRQHGLPLDTLEIDHDCATARLPAYVEFLRKLRQKLPSNIALSITALPTWLDSDQLAPLLTIPEQSVLQVHAVLNPMQGLFDAARARAWLNAYARRTRHPWRIALPTYGSRVSWDEQGRVRAIASEQASLTPAGASQELLVTPQSMLDFVTALDRHHPAGLRGIVWFRLPTDDDTRAWSVPSWQAVLARAPLLSNLQVQAQAGSNDDPHGVRDVMLINAGNADAHLPAVVRLDAACPLADGINGYVLQADAQGNYLQRTRDGLLPAWSRRNIGWIRCTQSNPDLHVEH